MFPYDIIAEMARLGLMGLTLPEEYGGSGGDFVAYILALEEISRVVIAPPRARATRPASH